MKRLVIFVWNYLFNHQVSPLRHIEPPRVCRRLFGLSYAASGCSASMAW